MVVTTSNGPRRGQYHILCHMYIHIKVYIGYFHDVFMSAAVKARHHCSALVAPAQCTQSVYMFRVALQP